MSGQPMSSPLGDAPNPFAPPGSTVEDPWNIGDPEALAIRRVSREEESYLNAMGIANYCYSFLFGAFFAFNLSYTIRYALGWINAPWSVQPHWVLNVVLHLVMTVLAVLAGYGFGRLRRWAFRIEAIFAACWLTSWYIGSFIYPPRPTAFLELLAGSVFFLALATPMVNLWDVRHSTVLEPKYKIVMKATSHIQIRANLPLELKLISGFLVLSSLVLIYFHEKGP